jgi:hypothetical protein
VRLARLEHKVPDLHAVPARVTDVDFEAELRRVARARDDHVYALELVLPQVVVGDLQRRLAEQVDEDLPRFRALDLERADVGLVDRDVEARLVRDAHRPEEHVAVGDREPETVLVQAQQDRVVDDPAVRGSDEDVLALSNGALVQVARNQHVRERKAVPSGDLHLSLDAHVPQRDPVQKLPVLLDRVAVVPRVVHVVVEAVHLYAVAPGGVEERRLADPCVQQNLGVLDELRHCSLTPLSHPVLYRLPRCHST